MVSLVYYLVFFLYLHACTGRLLLESDKQSNDHLQPSSQDIEISSMAKALSGGSSIVQLDNHKFYSVQERQNIGGKKNKNSSSWKILPRATGAETWRRIERSMVEPATSNNINNKTEEVEVMDYAQPHRKPPIHNKGT